MSVKPASVDKIACELSPWSYHHDPVPTLSQCDGQRADDIPQAPRLAPRGHLGRHKHDVHGIAGLRDLLLAGGWGISGAIRALHGACTSLSAGSKFLLAHGLQSRTSSGWFQILFAAPERICYAECTDTPDTYSTCCSWALMECNSAKNTL